MSHFRTIKDIDIAGKRLLIRVDFNVPLEDGQVASDRRITAALPMIRHALKHDSKIVLMTHLGRPGGEADPALSLKAVAERLFATRVPSSGTDRWGNSKTNRFVTERGRWCTRYAKPRLRL